MMEVTENSNLTSPSSENCKQDKTTTKSQGLLYTVEDTPHWGLCILLGFQHYLTMFGTSIAVPLLLGPVLCVRTDYVALANIIGSLLFVSGLVTLLQTTLGTRLPIIQGSSASFLAPTFAVLSLPQWSCPELDDFTNNTLAMDASNMTENSTQNDDNGWQSRLREIQGAILLASLLEIFVGVTGLIGLAMRFVGPLPIACTITLVGISVFTAVTKFCAHQWWIAVMTIILLTVFSQYLNKIKIPCALYGRKESGTKGCTTIKCPIFTLFPILMAIFVAWLVCAVLTKTNVFPNDKKAWGYQARTDSRISVLYDAPWFRVPYPFQWGWPTFSVAGVIGMLTAVTASTMESIGDYYACARIAGAPPPPIHALNRGIFMEGLGCAMAGMWGTATGTTSHSGNIGIIGITKVGSRRVVQAAAVFMILFSVIGKFGAVFVTIPQPILGGAFVVLYGMVVSVGISNLQYIDLNSSRNLFIFGFSIFLALALPQWMLQNGDDINTGIETLNQIFRVLLQTGMFIGGAVALILDNTIPGTDEERGLTVWRTRAEGDTTHHATQHSTYDFPRCMRFLPRWSWCKYIPISPAFQRRNSLSKEDEEAGQTSV